MPEKKSPLSIIVIFLGILVLYSGIRVIDNTTSWKKAADVPAPPLTEADKEYQAALAGAGSNDEKLTALWKLTLRPDWKAVAGTTSPVPLASDIRERAVRFYKANNIPQAASHLQILLQWAIHLQGEAARSAAPDDQGLQVAQIAADTAAACPNTLLYPAIRSQIQSLASSLHNELPADRLINKMVRSHDVAKSPRWRYLANRGVLERLLTETESNTLAGSSPKVVLKCWLLGCPLTPQLLQWCREESQPLDQQVTKLRSSLDAMLRNAPPAASR